MKLFLELIERETDTVVDRVDLTFMRQRQAERVMDGVDRYLNRERFYTRFTAISDMAQSAPKTW